MKESFVTHNNPLSTITEFRLMSWLSKASRDRGWSEEIITWLARTSASSWPFAEKGRKELEVELITSGQLFHQSCLCNTASINTQKEEIQRASGLKVWRSWESGTLGGMEASSPFPHYLPYASLSLAFICIIWNTANSKQALFSWVLWATLV